MLNNRRCKILQKVYAERQKVQDTPEIKAERQKVQETPRGKIGAVECESTNVELQWNSTKKCV
jgi:hypothetical protein